MKYQKLNNQKLPAKQYQRAVSNDQVSKRSPVITEAPKDLIPITRLVLISLYLTTTTNIATS